MSGINWIRQRGNGIQNLKKNMMNMKTWFKDKPFNEKKNRNKRKRDNRKRNFVTSTSTSAQRKGLYIVNSI